MYICIHILFKCIYMFIYLRISMGEKNTFKMNSEQQYKVSYFSELEVVTKYQIIT